MSSQVESAPMLVEAFGPLAHRVMCVAKHIPEVLNVVFTANKAAFHSYVIYLHRTRPLGNPNDLEVASSIMLARPEELLADPRFGDPSGLLRALSRLDAKAPIPYPAYLALGEFTRPGHVLAPIVDRLDSLDMKTIDSLIELDKHKAEKLMMAAGPTLVRTSSRRIQDLASTLSLLCAHDLVDAALCLNFGTAGSYEDLSRLALDALGPMKLPGLGIDVPEDGKLRDVRSFGEYRSVMRRFYPRFSLQHTEGVGTIKGATAWLVAQDEDGDAPEILVGLDIIARTPRGVIASIEQMHLPGHEDLDRETRLATERRIAALPGLTLVGSTLGRILGRLEELAVSVDDEEDAGGLSVAPDTEPEAPAAVGELSLAA